MSTTFELYGKSSIEEKWLIAICIRYSLKKKTEAIGIPPLAFHVCFLGFALSAVNLEKATDTKVDFIKLELRT